MSRFTLRPSAGSIAALALAGVVVAGGPTFANRASDTAAVQPSAATNVQLLASKAVKIAKGHTVALLSASPITQQAKCVDHGSGNFEVDIQIKSSTPGSVETSTSGWLALSGSFITNWSLGYSNLAMYAADYDVFTKTGVRQHYHVDYGVHVLGADCYVSQVRYSA